jgi:hypothetical protein
MRDYMIRKKKNNLIIDSLFIVSIIVLMANCQTKPKRYIDRLDECTYSDTEGKLENDLVPFDINKLSKESILSNCYTNIIIDSCMFIDHEKDTSLIYSLSDNISTINFYQREYNNGIRKDLSLFEYTITSNILKYKNGIEIGMRRDDFFDKIKRNSIDCDTFSIGEGLTGYYYYFVFRNDSLIRIERIMTKM